MQEHYLRPHSKRDFHAQASLLFGLVPDSCSFAYVLASEIAGRLLRGCFEEDGDGVIALCGAGLVEGFGAAVGDVRLCCGFEGGALAELGGEGGEGVRGGGFVGCWRRRLGV